MSGTSPLEILARRGGYTFPMQRSRTRRVAVVLGVVLAVSLRAGAEDPPAPGGAAMAWKLGVSDMAAYERRRMVMRGGQETPAAVDVVTVMGHDLRDGGLYLPTCCAREDLGEIFGFRTPASGTSEVRIPL